MKILAMCQGGHVRSVSLKFLLHYGLMGTAYGKGPMHDVLSIGWQSNSKETLEMLLEWADKIIVLEEGFRQYVPTQHHSKLLVFDVGPDRFGYAFNPELMDLLWKMVNDNLSEKKIKFGFDMHGVLSSHRWAREMAKALLSKGHEVHVISAVDNEAASRQWIAGLGISFTQVHCIHAVSHEDAGDKKAEVMRKNGIELLLDDVPPVIEGIRKAGLVGLHVA